MRTGTVKEPGLPAGPSSTRPATPTFSSTSLPLWVQSRATSPMENW